MRTRQSTISASALLLLAVCGEVAEASKHGLAHERIAALHRRRHNHHQLHEPLTERTEVSLDEGNTTVVEKRTGTCDFPSGVGGLVAVARNKQNAGWAMSPDQPCKCGQWCPYACPPGQVSMQWNPDVTSYEYPGSMQGGLYCDNNGNVQKPFPNKPHCQDGVGSFIAKNKANGGSCSICQTVLPGNEAMLIPTEVSPGSQQTLAVPDPSYWAGTSAHYYVNAPGIEPARACTWGTKDNPWGNWAAYVAGANADSAGNTYTKAGWNPIWLEAATPFRNTVPDYGIRLTCDGHCNGLPCEIDPAKNGVNEMTGSSSIGAGGASFCVVTAPKGVNVYLEVFGGSGSGSGGGGGNNNNNNNNAASPSQASPASTSTTPSSSPSSSTSSTTSTSTSSTSSSSPSATFTAGPQQLFENSTSNSTSRLGASSSKISAGGPVSVTSSSMGIGGASSSSSATSSSSKNGGVALGPSTSWIVGAVVAAAAAAAVMV